MKFWRLGRKREQALEKEIQHHLRMAAMEREERGATPRDAESGARREFGNVGLVKEVTRDVWGWRWLEDLFEDARYGLRVLSKNPAFTVAAVLAIALGVGLNVGIFSVLNGIALRPLPVPRAQQILSVNQVFHHTVSRNVHNGLSMFSYAEYLDYRDHNHVFGGLVAYEPFVEATLGGGHMQPLLGTLTSCNYFEVLNEHPVQGRGFVDTDCAAPGQNAVVVISDELWRGTFAGDASLVGKQIILNRTPCTVIGIAAPGFTGTEPAASAFWAPVTMQKELDAGMDRLGDSNMSWLALLGRVAPGVTIQQVHADLSVIAGRIDQSHPGRLTTLAISRATLFGRPDEREFLVPVASVVLAAFGLVLLIACANVSNLLLARASVRHKEIALRLSMGASRWRLVRQLLTESLLLSAAGGALGSLLALWSFAGVAHFMIAHLPASVPTPALNLAPDFTVLAYALALTLLTGVAFGLLPGLQSSRLDLNTALKGDGALSSGTSRKSGRVLRDAFVGAQIAVCMILLLAAGLLLRGLYHAQTIDPGFDVKNVASTFLNLQTLGFDENRATAFVESLRKRVADLPGVLELAQAENAPLSDNHSGDHFLIPGRAEKVAMEYNYVSPEFFSTVGIPIVRGRGFGVNDWRDGTPTIVTESTARRLWPGEDPLGKTFHDRLTGGVAGPERVVVGVTKDARVSKLGELDTMYVYFPAAPTRNLRSYLLIRFEGNVRDLNNSVREVARSIDADVPVQVATLEDGMEVWRAPARIVTGLSGALGGLALLLALIGVYGMVSYSVSRSVREIGIRMALGADGRKVMSHVLRQAMRPVMIGCAIGVAGCAGVSSVLSSLLFGLDAHDPIAFVSVPVFLLIVALVASYIPARRAMRVDPVVALRYE